MKDQDFLRERAEELTQLSEGETLVKTYHCTTVNGGEREGFITVTDRRLILAESSMKRDCRKTELPLETVGGADYEYIKGRNLGKMLWGLFFFLACATLVALPFLKAFGPVWLKYVLWSGAGVCFVLSIVLFAVKTHTLFVVRIYSKSPMTEFMSFTSSVRHKEFRWFVRPAADSLTMLRELGALILDVKEYGGAVREKYLTKFEQKELSKERALEAEKAKKQAVIDEENRKKLEEKQRRMRIREQKRLEKECKKGEKPSKDDKNAPDEKYFDILNK